MNKKYLAIFGCMFLVGLVAAAYSVLTVTPVMDVDEAFDNIGYGVIGDSEFPDWAVATSCGDITTWVDIDGMNLDTLYAGESLTICTQFDNLGSADLAYEIIATPSELTVSTDSTSGTATALSTTGDEITVVVDADSPPITDLTVDVELTRG